MHASVYIMTHRRCGIDRSSLLLHKKIARAAQQVPEQTKAQMQELTVQYCSLLS